MRMPSDCSSLLQTNTLVRLLLVEPKAVLAPYLRGEISDEAVYKKALLFLVLASLLFAITTVLHVPQQWQLTSAQIMFRFVAMLGFTLVLLFPLITMGWALLQKVSGWFWDVPVPFLKCVGIAGLGLTYYAGIFLLSLPLFWIQPVLPVLFELGLFVLNLTAFLLSVRLFAISYMVFGEVSARKAIWIAFFPMLLIGLVWLVNEVLVYFAMRPYWK